MFDIPDAKRVKRSDLFRDEDASSVSRGSTRSISPGGPFGNEDESILEQSYGFEYEFVAPNPQPSKPTLASSQSQEVINSQEDDQEFQFRLFTAKSKSAARPSQPDAAIADSRIRLSRTPEPAELADSLSLEQAHFLRPNRPDSYYFTSALPEETIQGLRSQYADVALSSADVLSRATSTKWPGAALPWRLIHVRLLGRSHRLKKLARATEVAPKTNDSNSLESKTSLKRPSKKRRILLRRRLALRQELAAQAMATEETEREKRTRRNREKKVKRKEREKRKRLEAPEGEGKPADDEEEEKGDGGDEGKEANDANMRSLGKEVHVKADNIQEREIRRENDSKSQAPDLIATQNATAAILLTNSTKSSAPARRAPTSRAPTAAGKLRPPTSVHPTRRQP